MNEPDRQPLTWSVRYLEQDDLDPDDDIRPGWYVLGLQGDLEYAVAVLHIAHHDEGMHAAASVAAVTAHLLNNYEQKRPAQVEAGDD